MTEVQKWADAAMFRSESHNAAEGPKAYLLTATPDPLGAVAACSKMYLGEVVRDLADVTDDERRRFLGDMQKTKLAMPLESVQLHFMLENVSRAFTHQLVRQRTAAYAQESMRFAVVEDMKEAVSMPPSLMGTLPLAEWLKKHEWKSLWTVDEFISNYASDEQKARFKWDDTVRTISNNYNDLVNSGMPAEDARGLMPTNIVTRVHYITNLRGLLDHAGNRLCTQAQAEWRIVFAQIAKSLRDYGSNQHYRVRTKTTSGLTNADWQFDALADLLKPVCYQRGKCVLEASFDRACSIRGRVTDNAKVGRPSSEWGKAENVPTATGELVHIGAIHTREWLADPSAARKRATT